MQFGSNSNDLKMVKEPNANIVPGKKRQLWREFKIILRNRIKLKKPKSLQQQTKMENFVVKTSGTDKKKFDIAIARFFYGSNIPFRAADSTEFKRWLISWLETPKFKIYRGATA